MEIKEMNIEELKARKANLRGMLDAEDADIEAIEAEGRAINAELEARQKAEEARAAIRQKIADGEGEVIETFEEATEERNTMTNVEVRSGDAYAEAFAKYIKTGKDEECRALLTETVNGTVPVPTFVEGIISTAWDEMPILSKVTRTNFAGNVKVGFELSATAAVVHTEGAAAPAEETLVLGIVTMVPETIKKWITISDEALEQNPVSLIEYVYRELAYRIFKYAEDEIVTKILAAPATATATAPNVGAITITQAGIGDIIDAEALLSDEATNLYVICSKSTEATYKKLGIAANYNVDPFDGLTVLNNDSIGTSVIVGDLKGVTANFVNGTDIQFKYDDLSLAEQDLVKVVGRLPIAIEVTACKRFAKITQ